MACRRVRPFSGCARRSPIKSSGDAGSTPATSTTTTTTTNLTDCNDSAFPPQPAPVNVVTAFPRRACDDLTVRGHSAGLVGARRGARAEEPRPGPRHYDRHVTDGPSVTRAEQSPRSASDADRSADARFCDVTSVPLAPNVEERGRLLEIDFDALPFTVRRVFVITDVPPGTRRGGHRHRSGAQVLVCISGRVEVELRRGAARTTVTLTPDGDGLCIPAGIWAAQRYLEKGSALVVLASDPFDPANYETSF